MSKTVDTIVAVVENGVLVEPGDPRPVPWWSFTKTVLATSALALVADEKLALDAVPAAGTYTLRHLLAHRAGLADYGWLKAYHAAVQAGEAPWPAEDMRRRVEEKFPPWAPGEKFSYSNVGYRQVADLIETAAGESLGRAIETRVFAPLGITGVKFAREKSDLAACATDAKWGDAKWGDAWSTYDPGWVYHGLLIGPASAAALFLDGLMRGGLLPPALLTEMRDVRALPWPAGHGGRPWHTAAYGLGLMGGADASGIHYEGHTGAGPASTFAAYRRGNRAVAVFAPGENQGFVEWKMIERMSRP